MDSVTKELVFGALKADVEIEIAAVAAGVFNGDERPEREDVETLMNVLFYWIALDDQRMEES